MKSIKELELNLRNPDVFHTQFHELGNTNILWISPQLTGRQLYKTILPYLFMEDMSIYTAISGIERHDPEAQLQDIHIELETTQVLWADIVVFPFTTQPLKHLYAQLRTINQNIKIYYSVDLNFYQMTREHPYYGIFGSSNNRTAIEDNMYFSDLVITSNINLQKLLVERLRDLAKERYAKIFNSPVKVCTVPFLIHEDVVKENLFYDVKDVLPKNGQFRVGIIASSSYAEDLIAFAPIFKEINKKYKDKVQLVLYGFDGTFITKDGVDGNRSNILDGIRFEFHKPTSIIQYFKELNSLNLDLCLIPLKSTDYNSTSENYNKWMECALMKVPVLTNGSVYPYSKLIQDGVNGFTYKQRGDVPAIIGKLMKDPNKCLEVAEAARKDVRENFQFTEANVETLKRSYMIDNIQD